MALAENIGMLFGRGAGQRLRLPDLDDQMTSLRTRLPKAQVNTAVWLFMPLASAASGLPAVAAKLGPKSAP